MNYYFETAKVTYPRLVMGCFKLKWRNDYLVHVEARELMMTSGWLNPSLPETDQITAAKHANYPDQYISTNVYKIY